MVRGGTGRALLELMGGRRRCGRYAQEQGGEVIGTF